MKGCENGAAREEPYPGLATNGRSKTIAAYAY